MEAAAQTAFDGDTATEDEITAGQAPVRPATLSFTRTGVNRDRMAERFSATPIFAEMVGDWDGPCRDLLVRV